MTMELDIALGQAFWIGLNGTSIDDRHTREIFHTFQPGGVVLFQRNVETAQQVQTLTSRLQKLSRVPLFMAVDQEGGHVERLHHIIGTIPPAMAQAACANRRAVKKLHLAHARLLRTLGFNVNFNPVLDLALTDADNGLGTRCFSSSPEQVTACADEVIQSYREAGVAVCGKHFPGLGATDVDSHIERPTVSRSWRKIKQEDLLPYRRLLNELPFIMVNHALYPDRNEEKPASLAPEIVTDFLLKQWRYPGLAVTDDLIMGAVSSSFSVPKAAEMSLQIGNHLFLICTPEQVRETYEKLLRKARSNSDFAHKIYLNANRIFYWKFRMNLQEERTYNMQEEIENLRNAGQEVSDSSITRLTPRSLSKSFRSCTIFLPRSKWLKGNSSELGEHLRSLGYNVEELFYALSLEDNEAELLAAQSQTDWNVVVVTSTLRNPGQATLLESLRELRKKLIVIDGAFPQDGMPEGIMFRLASYWTAPYAMKAVGKILSGEMKAKGTLPLEGRRV